MIKIEDVKKIIRESKSAKKSNNKVRLYTPELMLRKKENGAEYEVTEIDTTDENNPVFTIFRYDVNGDKTDQSMHTFSEIEDRFEIA
tara:strand:+ start:8254 stop:8514 length:261 start_codon:yes stop_codon:yes gene_type:complete